MSELEGRNGADVETIAVLEATIDRLSEHIGQMMTMLEDAHGEGLAAFKRIKRTSEVAVAIAAADAEAASS